ncbi:MAG: Cof-type HAD-IIB family hydrolase [Vulcanimicrobiaceae bacterium]
MTPTRPPLLLALDLDGTVVEPREPVRPAVIAAVKRAIAAGVRVTIVTGRMYVGARPFAHALGLTGPIVCYQGAVIADAQSGRFEREVALPYAVARAIYEAATPHGYHVQFYRDDQFFVEDDNAYARLYARTSGTQAQVVPSLLEAFAGRESTKVNIVTDPTHAADAFALMQRTVGDVAYVTRSNPEFVEMLSPSCNKGAAVRLVAAHYGIPMDRVMAIGDSYNDLPFLQAAGFAVAMGSAPSELKALADAIVGDVTADGVAEAIERFVLPAAADSLAG